MEKVIYALVVVGYKNSNIDNIDVCKNKKLFN